MGCAGASNVAPASNETTGSSARAAEKGDSGHEAHHEDRWRKTTLTQFGTLDQLNRAVLDGPTTVEEVGHGGDFGLGTFNALDGEMIVLDGVVYQFRSDGVLRVADRKEHSPFAAVIAFHSGKSFAISAPIAGYPALQAFITNSLPDQTQMIAIKVHGTFSSLKTRAPRRQTPPYPPLAEAVKTQAEFTHTNIRGTLVGFRLPTYLGTTNAAGYHFHFVSDDHTKGGHVLDASTDSATVEAQTLDRLQVTVAPPGD